MMNNHHKTQQTRAADLTPGDLVISNHSVKLIIFVNEKLTLTNYIMTHAPSGRTELDPSYLTPGVIGVKVNEEG